MTSNGLEAVFLENRARLLRFLAARGAGEAAEDLLQDLWFKLSAATTGPIANPLSYLYRAADNLMRDRYRAVRQSELRDSAWQESTGATVVGVSDEPSSERALIAREDLRRVEAALAEIGDRPRLIFRRHRIEGEGQREIAAALGVSLSTVESDLRKAYRAILLAKGAGDDEA